MKIVKEISFTELKQNYIEVQNFLENESGESFINNKTRIANDLNIWGDDNYYILNDFINKYNLDFSNFNYDEHFESEGEIFNGVNDLFDFLFFILNIIKFIVYLVFKPFSNEYSEKIRQFKFYIKVDKLERKDLNMGDLITSKIFKKFQLRENVQFVHTKSEIKNR